MTLGKLARRPRTGEMIESSYRRPAPAAGVYPLEPPRVTFWPK